MAACLSQQWPGDYQQRLHLVGSTTLHDLQEEQNQADMARLRHHQQQMGRQRAGRQGRSPGRRYAAVDGGAASPHCRATVAPPMGSPAQQSPVAAQPFNRGFPCPPYQGQWPYQGRAYHPYQCALVAAQGRGHGQG